MKLTIPQEKSPLLTIGNLPETAGEVFSYIKDALVQRGAPLKASSLSLHGQAEECLKSTWESWTQEDVDRASELYDHICAHIKTITSAKGGTDLDIIKDKAHKLHQGINAAIDDILAGTTGDPKKNPGDKEKLMESIRRWNNREAERAKAEADRLRKIAEKAEEDRKLAEAQVLAEEAARLKKEGHVEVAAEIQAEAEKIIDEPVFVPPPPVQAYKPSGGPSRRQFVKIEVTDPDKFLASVMCKEVIGILYQKAANMQASVAKKEILFFLNQQLAEAPDISREFISINESKLRKEAENLFDTFNYPGVKKWKE